MSKKQNKRNAFYYFMLDWKKREEAVGNYYASLREVQSSPGCSAAWQSLSAQEKQRYQALAKNPTKTSNTLKLNCRGESIEFLKQQEYELEEFNMVMRKYVTDVINEGFKNKKLDQVKFYFMHLNWLYITNDGVYAPVEYAIGEFTLQKGIGRFHHKIIHLKPKMGYTWEAVQTSRNSHKILPEFSEGEQDFRRLYVDLINFLKPVKTDNRYPPLFVTKKVYKGVYSVLDQLSEAGGRNNTFLVYSIEILFTALRNAALHKQSEEEDILVPIPEIIAEKEFSTGKYAFEKNIECSYHENIEGGSQYCSLALIRQWSYIICDYCCDWLGVKYIPGLNCPVSLASNFVCDEVQNFKLKSAQHDNAINYSENDRCEAFENTKEEEEEKEEKEEKEEEEKEEKEEKEEEEEEEESSACRKEENPVQLLDYSKTKGSKLLAGFSVSKLKTLRRPNTNVLDAVAGAVAAAPTTAPTTAENIHRKISITHFTDVNIRLARGTAVRSRFAKPKIGIGRGSGAVP